MPWLEKDSNDASQNLLFVHIPRSGGTSLTQSHGVPARSIKNAKGIHRRLGMMFFFYNYYLWETDNFPMWTQWNAVWLSMTLFNIWARQFYLSRDDNDEIEHDGYRRLVNFNIFFCVFHIAAVSVIFVAPNFGRYPLIRHANLYLAEYILFMESKECLTGMGLRGWILHLTAHKMLNYGYVTPHEFETSCSLSIVRNPYSRMVSIYMYNRFSNRFGAHESFRDFVESWHTNVFRHYRENGILDEWDMPTHAIPQFEYTHFEGVQLVHSIVKFEELGSLIRVLKTTNATAKENGNAGGEEEKEIETNHSPSSLSDLPEIVRAAFVGMPNVNRRETRKPWHEYYDQETLDKTYELYRMDFAIFGYSTTINERPDLKPPPPPLSSCNGISETELIDLGFELPFSHDTVASISGKQRERRKALLSKAVSLSCQRSSMDGMTRRRLYGSSSGSSSSNGRRSKKQN